MRFFIIILLFLLPQTQQQLTVGVSMTPLIEFEENIIVNEETQLTLIPGLQPHMLFWHHVDTILPTPSNLIITFPYTGEYVPYIRNSAQYKYTITILEK